MSDSTLFKRAFTRGLNAELVRSGAVSYPTKEAADLAADYVADHAGMPDPATEGEQVSLKVAHDLCTLLVRASDALCKQAGYVDPGLSKTAASVNPAELAASDALALMQKVAYENETPNTAESAAQHNAAARLDQRNRPTGYAHDGVGNYIDQGRGATGTEEPAERGDRVEGSNSATENTAKEAMARAIASLRKVAENPYTGHPNTPEAAAQHTDAAKLDQKNRPAGYAHKGVDGVGKSDVKATGSAIVGKEEHAHRSDRVSGSNTVTPLAKSAMIAFDKTAALVIPYLPANLSDAQKVAHINAMSPLSTMGKAKYLGNMYVAYGADKTAAVQTAAHFLKRAEEDAAHEDMEVAQAMEQAAEELEDKARAEGGEGEPAAEEAAEAADGAKQAAALQRLTAAVARIAG